MSWVKHSTCWRKEDLCKDLDPPKHASHIQGKSEKLGLENWISLGKEAQWIKARGTIPLCRGFHQALSLLVAQFFVHLLEHCSSPPNPARPCLLLLLTQNWALGQSCLFLVLSFSETYKPASNHWMWAGTEPAIYQLLLQRARINCYHSSKDLSLGQHFYQQWRPLESRWITIMGTHKAGGGIGQALKNNVAFPLILGLADLLWEKPETCIERLG